MQQRKKTPYTLLILFLFILIFNFSLIFSPLFLPNDSVHNLDGSMLLIDNDFKGMPVPINLLYISGDILCHQKESRE